MTFEDAYARVAMAGRELGSGPAEAATRLTDFDNGSAWLIARKCPVNNARCIMLGTAIGLVMAEDPIALQTLADITAEWRDQQ